MNTKLNSILVITSGLFAVIIMLFYASNAVNSRLLSSQIYLDYAQQQPSGLGKYFLFFRGSTPPVPTNVITDAPNTGEGTLPTNPEELDEYFRLHPEELEKYRSEPFPALRPPSLDETAKDFGRDTVEQCNLPTGPIVEPWWRAAGENYD